jgi:hypothetical protein
VALRAMAVGAWVSMATAGPAAWQVLAEGRGHRCGRPAGTLVQIRG